MITETIALLGLRAKDKISGVEGVVTTVSFDLYGCVQATLAPAADADGKPRDLFGWIDVQRLTVTGLNEPRVMPVPDFDRVALPADHDHGPAEKPRAR